MTGIGVLLIELQVHLRRIECVKLDFSEEPSHMWAKWILILRWYVDYEDEETDCSSDIFEVDLNLVTYKPSTSNRLIFLTDPKHKQLTPFISKSSQMRLGLPSTAVVGDRFGVSDRAVAAIASSVLHDVGPITSNNSDLVVDNNKLRTEKASSFKL
uniref:Uncharacterized protein n=1 Tax=Araneus ventricosus TaxID=182803 RepID=A0A4Y2VVH7_ARAVE|nr:hypothetical protein AVEN_133464-1 [Araneus ventricosus]